MRVQLSQSAADENGRTQPGANSTSDDEIQNPGKMKGLGIWDCHVHVFPEASRFPFAPERRYTPGLAGIRELREMMGRTGTDHAVIVQATPYGNDHRSLIGTLRSLGSIARGVACFLPGFTPSKAGLRELADAGVVALRIHALNKQSADEDAAMASWAAQLANDMGWHIEIQCGRNRFELVEQVARQFGGPIVLDHLARRTPETLDAFFKLAAQFPIYIKLSGLYRNPCPKTALTVAHRVLETLPGRAIWGSDWPHTPLAEQTTLNSETDADPFLDIDSKAEFEAIFSGASERTLLRVLRENPLQLYRKTS